MKILFSLDSLTNAGTEKSTLDILTHFSKETVTKVIHFYPGFDLQSSYEKAGIPLFYAGLKGKRSFIKGMLTLIKIIKKEKPDLIISSIMRSNFISRFAGLFTGTPVVGTFISDSYNPSRMEDMRKKKKYAGFRFFWIVDRLTSGIPVYWISNALSIAKTNAQALGIRKKKIKVIYRGREQSLFPQWQPLNNNETFRFVFIGRLLELKGIGELLTASKIVKDNYPHVKLDIYGEGRFRKKAEEIITQLRLRDTISLHGKVPVGWKKLYEADCFVFPSRYEGFSGSLVEAMMAGIPIIASDIPMNLEAVSNETAVTFPVEDSEKLAASMIKVIENYPAMVEMGKRARVVATEKFDIKKIALEYESFLKSIVDNKVDQESLV